MTTDRTTARAAHVENGRPPGPGHVGGAAIHPRFLRSGPWALAAVVALLFGLSFATSYAALHDYALELQFTREFAIAFPLVLDAVIVVLAVTLLLERALGRRTISIKGWQFTVHLPTWPLLALWIFFAGSVAGNVGHAPPLLAAQLVAAVPPVSAALTFHLLLRLLDRASSLRAIAEAYDERDVEERERAAARKARRDRIKTAGLQHHRPTAPGRSPARPVSLDATAPVNGHSTRRALPSSRPVTPNNGDDESAAVGTTAKDMEELRRRVLAAIGRGEHVTGQTVGRWLGVSARTGRRRLATVLEDGRTSRDAASES